MPCRFHKSEGKICPCDRYQRRDSRILIIKLGAAGDVIRTTPLIRKLKKLWPNCEISWLTYVPEILPREVDFKLNFTLPNIISLMADEFDILYNLAKDKEACGLTNLIRAKKKKGFCFKNGRCSYLGHSAENKFMTGIDDNLNRTNRSSYVEEIFEIAELPFNGEKYLLDKPTREPQFIFDEAKPLIGLNTGCGCRWETRLWPEEYWVNLAERLLSDGLAVLLLGGPLEDAKNRSIAQKSSAIYLGHFPLKKFISLIDCCNLIVTSVTMALHIAIGLEKKIVLFNNVFNRNEFELYGLGKIIEPKVNCLGCYKSKCSQNCMADIPPELVYERIKEFIGK